jgi:hypothetical protein
MDCMVSTPLINLLVRTHRRPRQMTACLESINRQQYRNRMTWLIADDAETIAYAEKEYMEGRADKLVKTSKQATEDRHGDFADIMSRGLVAEDGYRRFWYDLHLNPVIQQITEGWIWIVDDDKTLPPESLSMISKHCTDPHRVVVGRYWRPKNSVPHPQYMTYPFTACQIDSGCYIFHNMHREKASFDGHALDDWRFANDLCRGLEIQWLDSIIIRADNNGQQGRGEF